MKIKLIPFGPKDKDWQFEVCYELIFGCYANRLDVLYVRLHSDDGEIMDITEVHEHIAPTLMSEIKKLLTDTMNIYHNVYSEENQEKARASINAANERRIKDNLVTAPLGEYKQQMKFHKSLFDEFKEPEIAIIPIHKDDLSKAIALAKEYWPHAEVKGISAFSDGGSGVEILFNLKYNSNERE